MLPTEHIIYKDVDVAIPSRRKDPVAEIREIEHSEMELPDLTSQLCDTMDVGAASFDVTVADNANKITIDIPSAPFEWTKKDEERFRLLISKEAVESVTRSELDELERLQHWRREYIAPVTFDEVINSIRQKEITTDLMEALNRYVQFFNTTSKKESAR